MEALDALGLLVSGLCSRQGLGEASGADTRGWSSAGPRPWADPACPYPYSRFVCGPSEDTVSHVQAAVFAPKKVPKKLASLSPNHTLPPTARWRTPGPADQGGQLLA